jgi:hypothetical protein
MIERYKRVDAKTLELDMTIDDPGAAAYFRRHPRLFIYFQAEYTGFATMKSGFAPAFGRNFCTRPASTSAT